MARPASILGQQLKVHSCTHRSKQGLPASPASRFSGRRTSRLDGMAGVTVCSKAQTSSRPSSAHCLSSLRVQVLDRQEEGTQRSKPCGSQDEEQKCLARGCRALPQVCKPDEGTPARAPTCEALPSALLLCSHQAEREERTCGSSMSWPAGSSRVSLMNAMEQTCLNGHRLMCLAVRMSERIPRHIALPARHLQKIVNSGGR